MITLLRLDERLIHGQIAIKWSRHTGVDRIDSVVVSTLCDRVAPHGCGPHHGSQRCGGSQ